MAQIRCEILAHTIKLIADSRHRAPRDCCRTAKGLRKVCPNGVLTARGTEGSNLLSSSGESSANLIFRDKPYRQQAEKLRAERQARGEVAQSVQPTWAPGSMEWQADRKN